MNLFGKFRVRSVERDRQTDAARFKRLDRFLADLADEIGRERDGLRARHDEAMRDAAFAQDRVEDGRADRQLSHQVDTLTTTMLRYADRIDCLEKQLTFIRQAAEQGRDFEDMLHDNALNAAP